MTKLSYLYLYNGDEKVDHGSRRSTSAQMVALVCLTNLREKEYQAQMFNDEIMVMYLVISMYLLANSRPILATLVFSLAYSVKAGALLMLPAFVGSL
jgi:hypothetical protein